MKILSFESSCDETAVAVVSIGNKNSFKLLSNEIFSQAEFHAKTFGVVPEVAARMHIESIIPLAELALKKAGVSVTQIDCIAVTAGPGLITSLMVGVDTAKTIAFALKMPIIAVNHVEAHIYSPFILGSEFRISDFDRVFPAISLVVSGGHTELFLVKGFLNYKKIGQTLDDAAGECFDKIARLLKLPYPGGPSISKAAIKGNPNAIAFPRPMIKSGNFDFSFSGLKTAVLYYLRDNSPLPPLKLRGGEGALRKADIAASAQAAIVDVLAAKTVGAAKKHNAKTIMLGGGVAANKLLRERLKTESQKLKIDFLTAQPEYCTDNAAMIGLVGYLHAKSGNFTELKKVIAQPDWNI